MTNLTTVILGLSSAYALLGVLLLGASVYARLPLSVKAGAILVTSTFYVVSFLGMRALLGWSSIDPLPAHFKLLGARIVEPHSLAGDPGAIHLWVEALDEDNRPSGVPRAYRLPYTAKLAEKTEAAVQASAEGKPQEGGHTADFGTGEGGTSELTAREATPSSITTTSGGDPASGGPLDPAFAPDHSGGIVFSPLPPPRMPQKDAP
jgi:hypothetical protein